MIMKSQSTNEYIQFFIFDLINKGKSNKAKWSFCLRYNKITDLLAYFERTWLCDLEHCEEVNCLEEDEEKALKAYKLLKIRCKYGNA